MRATYLYLAALGLAGASLSSCSRASYSFNPATPAYLHPEPVAAAPLAPLPQPVAAAPATLPPAAPAALSARAATRPVARLAPSAARYTAPAPAALAAPVPKPALAQRLVLAKLGRKLAHATSQHQNAASTTETAARSGSLTVAIIGLIALVVGLIIGSGFLITIGAIVLVVGLILALLSIF